MTVDAVHTERGRRIPRARRRVHARHAAGVLRPFRGAQGDARHRARLRGVRGPDTPRDRAADGAGADRAVAVRVRGLPRQPHPLPPGEGGRGRGSARGDGRRRDRPVPDVARRDVQRARPRQAAAARRRAHSSHGRAPEPALPRRPPHRPRGRAASSTRRTTTSSTSASASGSTSSPPSAARCSTTRRSCGSTRATRCSATRLGFGLDEARPWDVGRLFRAPELDELYPSDKMLPALEATLTELGIDIRSQANVHLDLEVAAEQVAARLLRSDRSAGKGDARHPADRRQGRLGGALPRGGSHRALRLHERHPVDGGQAARRQRGHRGLGDAVAASRDRASVAEPAARRPGRERAREGRRRLAPLLRAPVLREAPVRDRAASRPTTRRRCGAATSRSSRTR